MFGTSTPDEAYFARFDAFSLWDNSVIDAAQTGPWCLVQGLGQDLGIRAVVWVQDVGGMNPFSSRGSCDGSCRSP